jgi:biotin-[acetyl-CoA-carboxylase] ligase BirA-like protein
MIVYADNLNYASKIVPNITSWKSCSIININQSDRSFIGYILKSKNIYYSEIESNSNWKYLVVKKHSDQSQFDILYELSKNKTDLPDGILCLSDTGTKFHGYRNRDWHAQSGNLHLSILRKPGISLSNFHVGFLILAAVSVIQTIDLIPDLKGKAWIKWVNDIFIDESKVSGVITQSHTIGEIVSGVIFGIGLNIAQAPNVESELFIRSTTYLHKYLENKNIYDIHFIFTNFISILKNNYAELLLEGNEKLFNFYCNRSKLIGNNVVIYSDSQGGEYQIIAKGKVIDIGKNLELYLENQKYPVTKGRLIFS